MPAELHQSYIDDCVRFFGWEGCRGIRQWSPPASPSREYIYSGGMRLATLTSTTTTYHHADHLSVRVNTDANGNKIGEQGHYPYGEAWYRANTTTKFIFTSYERDSESGHDYAMARYYHVPFGRFCSADPVFGSPGDPQSWNRYVYARDNPVNLTDPSGMSWLSSFFKLLLDVLSGPFASNKGGWIGASPQGSDNPWSELDNVIKPPMQLPGIDTKDWFSQGFLSGVTGTGAPDDLWTYHVDVAWPFLPENNGSRWWKKIDCANRFANDHSVAAALGAQNTFVGKALGGNIFGGLGELGVAVFGGGDFSSKDGAALAYGGAGLGIPIPGSHPGLNGAGGVVQDGIVKVGAQYGYNILTGGAQLSTEALEETATGVGLVKAGYDALSYGYGLYKCRHE